MGFQFFWVLGNSNNDEYSEGKWKFYFSLFLNNDWRIVPIKRILCSSIYFHFQEGYLKIFQ